MHIAMLSQVKVCSQYLIPYARLRGCNDTVSALFVICTNDLPQLSALLHSFVTCALDQSSEYRKASSEDVESGAKLDTVL